MANTKFTGRSDSYIFEDAGGKRDQLEQAILSELQAKQYPLKATIQTLKGCLLYTSPSPRDTR